MLANVIIIDSTERRQGRRLAVESGSTLRANSRAIDVIVFDLSETGCAIKTNITIGVGTEISVGLVGFGTFDAKVVRNDGDILGCEFFQPIDAYIVSNAFLSSTVMLATGLPVLPVTDVSLSEVEPEKWPIGYRTLFLASSSALLWALIGGGVLAIL